MQLWHSMDSFHIYHIQAPLFMRQSAAWSRAQAKRNAILGKFQHILLIFLVFWAV